MRDDAEGKFAIVALAARVPGAADADTFWRNSLAGRVSIERFAREEMIADGVPPDELGQVGYVAAKGIVADATRFDAFLFGYSPAEAAAIDPQQRVFLECALEVLERAAIDPQRFAGQIGIFAGQFLSTYLLRNLVGRVDVVERLGIATVFQGNTVDQLATRVAYKLDLRGPAVTVQSACSTSLVAVHLACRALAAYECDAALAGGVTLTFPQRAGYAPGAGGIVSPDGTCRPFDAAANGTVFSDGVGIVALRRLRDALDDGDPIRAVILGSAVTNDGDRKVAYSAPSVEGQLRAIVEAMEVAGASPSSIGFVETHGTGTPVGDPIEVEALRRAYRGAPPGSRVALGAAKANIGHLDAAAGVVGLIKAVLAVERGIVPPVASFATPNPALPLAGTPFVLPEQAAPWPDTTRPRRAAVSAFGVGGTNAHAVLEQAPQRARERAASGAFLIPVSAKTRSALAASCERIAAAVDDDGAVGPQTLQTTLALGRRAMEWRTTAIVGEPRCGAVVRAAVSAATYASPREAVFLFPGQGALGAGLDRSLYEANADFREVFDELANDLRVRHGIDLGPALFGGERARLWDTRLAQPASFAISYALACALQRRGVEPAAIVGHSVGEYAGAVLAGVLSAADALDVLVVRGALMAAQGEGVMLAVPLSASEAVSRLEPGLELAADNGPNAAVVAGPPGEVARFEQRLAREGITGTRLETSHAFHTAAVEPFLGAFRSALAKAALRPARRPIVSTLTGRAAAPEELANVEYWVRHAREPVRFRAAVETAAEQRGRVFVEVGPGGQLSQLARRIVGERAPVVALLDPRTGGDLNEAFLRGLGRLWSVGIELRWEAIGDRAVRRVELPPHPLEGDVHYYERARDAETAPVARRAVSDDVARWIGAPLFVPAPGRPARRIGEKRRRWLLYVPHPDAFADLADYLESRGQIVTRVAPGGAFRRTARGAYEMRLGDAADTSALMRELRGLVRTPNVVLHLLAAGDAVPARADLLGPFLALARSFAAESAATEVRLGVVTRGAFDVLGTETLAPEVAAVVGPAIVLPQEQTVFAVRHVDLGDGGLRPADYARVVERVLGDDDDALALRRGRAYRLDVLPVAVDPAAAPIRAGGVYAVIGGLGAVGSALCERLVREHGAVVLAIGRRVFPPREAWDTVDSSLSAAVQRVREIEAGARGRLEIVTADVRDAARLTEVFRDARRRFGALHGIVHAAGTAGGDAMLRDTLERAEEIFSVKAGGAQALARAVADGGVEDTLDFVALCSSTAGLVGGPGQWSYAAANAYLDTFAAERARANGTRWIAIDWDTFDAGIAVRDSDGASRALRELRDRVAIDAPRAGLAFEYALAAGEPRVVVSRLIARGLADARALFGRLAAEELHEKHTRPELDVPYAAPRTELEERIAAVWSEVLGVDQPGIDDCFTDLGGHSLLAAQLVARLRQAFDVDLSLGVLFEKDTIAQLSAEIERSIVAELEGLAPAP